MSHNRFQIRIVCALLLLSFVSSPAFGEWSIVVDKDEMTGELTALARSPVTTATKPMSFPNNGVEAILGIACNSKKEWAYIAFNQVPNLNKTRTENGYYEFKIRIKWDEAVEHADMFQDWGEPYLYFTDNNKINKIITSNMLLAEIDWYREGLRYFKFDLNGSSTALSKIRSMCLGN